MGDRDVLLHEVLDRIAGIPDAVRQTLTDHLWATIPTFVNEFTYMAAMAPGTLTVMRQNDSLEVIRSIVAVVPSGGTGLITLGNLKIPVGAGLFNPPNVNLLLNATDVRTLVTAGATGDCLLWLSGDALPTFGILPR